MNNVDRLFESSNGLAEFTTGYFQYLGEVLAAIDPLEVECFGRELLEARERGNTIFFLGNGGSAATASHFANDIGIGTRSLVRPFKAMSITDNNAVLTAIGNDEGYEKIFVHQLRLFLEPGDVVVGISASGNSPNVLKAMDYANRNGALTIGLTAFDGGKLRGMVRYGVHVPTEAKEYGPAEDVHMILDHVIGSYLQRIVLGESIQRTRGVG